MFTLIDFVILIWSFFPNAVMYRMFVVQKGGRERDPDTGRYRSKTFVLTLNLGAAVVSWVFLYPMMTTVINNLCAGNPLMVWLLLGLGFLIYYKLLKP